jgi:signal transduction histidine kinase
MIRRLRSGSRTRRTFRTDLAVTLLALTFDLLVWNGDRQLRSGGILPIWVIPLTSVVAFATVMLRRRHPTPVFVGQLTYATVWALLVPSYTSIAGVLVALYAVALLRPPATSTLALASCALPFGLQVYNSVGRFRGPEILGAIVFALVIALPPLAAWGLGFRTWLAHARMAKLTASQQAETANALRMERLSIARELHDIIAHSVSVMVMQAAGARAIIATDPPRAAAAFKTIQDVGTQSMGELGRLLDVLRTTGDEDAVVRPAQQPNLRDLEQLLEKTRTAGLAVSMSVDGTPRPLDPSVSLAAYRVIQESLTNTIKHAGAGATARVHLTWDHQFLTVAVEDRTGTQPAKAPPNGLSTGHGLLGLRERVRFVGGSFNAHAIHGGSPS